MGKLYRKAARIVDNQNHIKEKVDFLLIHAVVFLSISQTTEIHHPPQQFNVTYHCATCFSSHETSSGISYYNNLKKREYVLAYMRKCTYDGVFRLFWRR